MLRPRIQSANLHIVRVTLGDIERLEAYREELLIVPRDYSCTSLDVVIERPSILSRLAVRRSLGRPLTKV